MRTFNIDGKKQLVMPRKVYDMLVPSLLILFGYNISLGKINSYVIPCLAFGIVIGSYIVLNIWFDQNKKTYQGVGVSISNLLNKLDSYEQTKFIIYGCLGNAISEEFMYRGIFFNELTKLVSLKWAYLFQSLIFGFAHFRAGFPNGMIGSILASLFGFFMALLYNETGGILFPIMIHTCVDIIINRIALSMS